MNTQISPKLAALVVALMINGLITSGVAYLFNSQAHGVAAMSLAQTHATVKGIV